MRHLLPFAILALSGCATPQAAAPLPFPGSAYAWVTFDAAGQRGGGAAGLADRAQSRQLTLDDPVRVASVSKLVVALGVMRLVEQRRLDLDEDISGRLGWSLRNPAHPQVPITLRMLLSHTSGLKDEGDNYVIPLGTTVRQMTDRPEAFDAEHVPGRFFRYSNLNYPVIASVMERATGERFDRLIHRLVLKPLALDACFNWTMCSDARLARAVVLYRPDGTVARDDLGGRQPDCPVATSGPGCDLDTYVLGSNGALFSPQGGLRASVRDLAVIGRLLLNGGRHGGQPFLTEASVEAMLRPAWTFDGSNGDTSGGFYCAYGLGTQTLPAAKAECRDDLFGSGRVAAGHAGEAYGLRSGLWIDPNRRVGIAFFAANNPSPEPPSRTAYSAAEEWLAAKLPH